VCVCVCVCVAKQVNSDVEFESLEDRLMSMLDYLDSGGVRRGAGGAAQEEGVAAADLPDSQLSQDNAAAISKLARNLVRVPLV